MPKTYNYMILKEVAAIVQFHFHALTSNVFFKRQLNMLTAN